jgi:hypothetical protein
MNIWNWLSGNDDNNSEDYKEGDVISSDGNDIVVDKTVSMPGEDGWEQVGVYGHIVGDEPTDVDESGNLQYDSSQFYPYDDID